MSAKRIIIFCAQALFIQAALSQCASRAAMSAFPGTSALAYPYGLPTPAYDGFAYDGYAGWTGRGVACDNYYPSAFALDFSPTSGGSLPISSGSAIAPYGLTVTSDNVYEGNLAAAGELPFVGTVSVDTVLPTTGTGAISHYCGDGINAMVSDTSAVARNYIGASYIPATASIAPAFTVPGLGYQVEWAHKGCGCGY